VLPSSKEQDYREKQESQIQFCSDFCSGFSCPLNWHYYNEMCYYPSDSSDEVDQSTARKKCLKMGADLVSISDQAEMDFVLSISYDPLVFALKLPRS